MYIEHPSETARLTAEAERLERETQAVRSLNDMMALVCAELEARQGHRHASEDGLQAVAKA